MFNSSSNHSLKGDGRGSGWGWWVYCREFQNNIYYSCASNMSKQEDDILHMYDDIVRVSEVTSGCLRHPAGDELTLPQKITLNYNHLITIDDILLFPHKRYIIPPYPPLENSTPQMRLTTDRLGFFWTRPAGLYTATRHDVPKGFPRWPIHLWWDPATHAWPRDVSPRALIP